MEDLTGKVIRLEKTKFTVVAHDTLCGEEIIILSHKITKKSPAVAKTIQDLGYSNRQEIQYSKELINRTKREFSEILQSSDPQVKVASIDTNDNLIESTVTIYGLDLLDPNMLNVKIDEFKMKFNFEDLCNNRLLYLQWKKLGEVGADDTDATDESFRMNLHDLVEDFMERII